MVGLVSAEQIEIHGHRVNLLTKWSDGVKSSTPLLHRSFGTHMTHGSTALRTPQTFEAFRTAHLWELRWAGTEVNMVPNSSDFTSEIL
jgi:hypothetical protein